MKSLNELLAPQRHVDVSLSDLPKEMGTRLRWQRTAFNLRQIDMAERAFGKSSEKSIPISGKKKGSEIIRAL
jgi:hypothetical protein